MHPALIRAAAVITGVLVTVREDSDIAADPPGFDRTAFLERLGKDLPAFFDKAFQIDRQPLNR